MTGKYQCFLSVDCGGSRSQQAENLGLLTMCRCIAIALKLQKSSEPHVLLRKKSDQRIRACMVSSGFLVLICIGYRSTTNAARPPNSIRTSTREFYTSLGFRGYSVWLSTVLRL